MSTTKRTFGTIIQRGKHSWVGRYYRHGKRYNTATYGTKTGAKDALARIHATILNGTWQPATARHTPPATYAEWANEWLRLQVIEGKSPNTIRARASQLKNHVTPHIGSLTIDKITTDHIRALYDTARTTQKPASARNTMLALSASLTAAVERGLIPSNPATGVRGMFATHRRQRPPVTLTADQLDLIIGHAPAHLRAAYLAASYGCLRYGEVAGLATDDVDPSAHTLTVNGSVARDTNGGLSYGRPKTQAAYRTVTLPERHWHHIATHLEYYVHDDGRLFVDPATNSGYYSNQKLNKHLQQTALAIKIDPFPHMHDLRHSGLTLYGQTGATLADLMARAGHTDAKTVMIYQHATITRDRELANRL